MEIITKESVENIIEILDKNGRPLDRELFYFLIGINNKSDSVISELTKFPNNDGGFGNCLEPDVRFPGSSALASSIALKIFQEVKASSSLPQVQKLIEYFINTFDVDNQRWRIVPDEIKDYPHAPWWNSEDIVESFRGCYANPRAEIASGLLFYQDLLDKEFLETLMDSIVEYFLEEDTDTTMHDLICYQSLFDSEFFEHNDKLKVIEKLEGLIIKLTEADSSKWGSYCLKPLWIGPGPSSTANKLISSAIEENLNFEIKEFKKKGCWEPNWNWGDSYPKDWKLAKKEWASYLVTKNFRVFICHGRVEK